jgi:hypothetical protein
VIIISLKSSPKNKLLFFLKLFIFAHLTIDGFRHRGETLDAEIVRWWKFSKTSFLDSLCEAHGGWSASKFFIHNFFIFRRDTLPHFFYARTIPQLKNQKILFFSVYFNFYTPKRDLRKGEFFVHHFAIFHFPNLSRWIMKN